MSREPKDNPQRPRSPMVRLLRDEYEALLGRLEEAEERAAVAEHQLSMRKGEGNLWLTGEEVNRLLDGACPITVWRKKRGMTLRGLAAIAEVSPSLLSQIEGGTKNGSVETLRRLAHALKVDLDTLVT